MGKIYNFIQPGSIRDSVSERSGKATLTVSSNPEKSLISSVLRDKDVNNATAHGVAGTMFHAFPEEWTWIESYWNQHKKTPSKNAFKDQFPDFRLQAVNDTSHYADQVRKAHSRSLLLGMINDAADKLADGKTEQAAALVQSSIVKVAAAMGTAHDSDIFADYDDIQLDIERRVKRVADTGSAGVPTGFVTVDERTGGPQPGQLWIVAARLGEGKSWWMQAAATAAVMHGYTVQFDALEQSRIEVSMRIHGFLSSTVGQHLFQTSDLMQGRNFDMREYKRFLRRLKSDITGKLHIADNTRGRMGLTSIAAQFERNRPDICFVDYITLLDKKGNDWQDVNALSQGLKQLGEEYQVPIVAAAQLNRAAGLGKEPPGAEAIAQSDGIGQDADVVITGKQSSPLTMVHKMVKNRNGQGGFKWYSQFEPGKGIFQEVTYDKYLDLMDRAATESEAANADLSKHNSSTKQIAKKPLAKKSLR